MNQKRGKQPYRPEPYSLNPDIYVLYELEWNGDVIKPGDKIKFKGEYGKTFKFRLLAHNIRLDRTWIDCMDCESGEFRSLRVDKLKTVIRPKRTRRRTKQSV